MRPPVEIVDVATVEVALKFPNVGVEVAITWPDPSVERRELMATPEIFMALRYELPEMVRAVDEA